MVSKLVSLLVFETNEYLKLLLLHPLLGCQKMSKDWIFFIRTKNWDYFQNWGLIFVSSGHMGPFFGQNVQIKAIFVDQFGPFFENLPCNNNDKIHNIPSVTKVRSFVKDKSHGKYPQDFKTFKVSVWLVNQSEASIWTCSWFGCKYNEKIRFCFFKKIRSSSFVIIW